MTFQILPQIGNPWQSRVWTSPNPHRNPYAQEFRMILQSVAHGNFSVPLVHWFSLGPDCSICSLHCSTVQSSLAQKDAAKMDWNSKVNFHSFLGKTQGSFTIKGHQQAKHLKWRQSLTRKSRDWNGRSMSSLYQAGVGMNQGALLAKHMPWSKTSFQHTNNGDSWSWTRSTRNGLNRCVTMPPWGTSAARPFAWAAAAGRLQRSKICQSNVRWTYHQDGNSWN
jgi:hypothetical protein